MNRKLIYSIVTNNYDAVKPAKVYPGFDYWLFSDDEDLQVPGWETKPLPKSGDPIRQQRMVKINSCKYAVGYDVSIYVDGNIELIKNPAELLDQHFSGGVLTSVHPKRTTIIEEADEVLRKKKDLPKKVNKTLEYAEQVGFDPEIGLFETMVMVRDQSDRVKLLERKWSEILENYSHRDQLSLPIASFLTGVKVEAIPRATTFNYMKRNRGHNFSLKFKKNGKRHVTKFSKVVKQFKNLLDT